MPTTRYPSPASVTARRWRVLGVITLVALCVGLLLLLERPKSPTPVPSFDDPIGALDPASVPNGWAPDVEKAARVAHLPAPVLAAQLQVESKWDPKATSPAGAQGLAQFTPDAWKTYGKGDPFDPHDAIAAQGRLMREMRRRAVIAHLPVNTTTLALAGYNAGFENVVKYGGVPPFDETRGYVDAVARAMGRYAKPLPSPSTSSSH